MLGSNRDTGNENSVEPPKLGLRFVAQVTVEGFAILSRSVIQ